MDALVHLDLRSTSDKEWDDMDCFYVRIYFNRLNFQHFSGVKSSVAVKL